MRHTPPIRASAFQNDVKQVERNAYGAKRAVAEVREKMDRYRQRKDAQQLLPKIAAAERAVDALYAELQEIKGGRR